MVLTPDFAPVVGNDEKFPFVAEDEGEGDADEGAAEPDDDSGDEQL